MNSSYHPSYNLHSSNCITFCSLKGLKSNGLKISLKENYFFKSELGAQLSNSVFKNVYLLGVSGALELADVSSELPGLKRMPGITKWKVLT